MSDAKKPGVMVYFEVRTLIERMSTHEAGLLFRAILAYGETGEVPELPDKLYVFWPLIQMRLDVDERKYQSVINKRKYGGYCRSEKAKGNEPLEYNVWLAEQYEAVEGSPFPIMWSAEGSTDDHMLAHDTQQQYTAPSYNVQQ